MPYHPPILTNKHPRTQWGTKQKFMADPRAWWNDFWAKTHHLQSFGTAEPCAAHTAIAQIMHRHTNVRLVTQNIDRLHWKAGVDSARYIETHGAIGLFRCTNPRCIYAAEKILDNVRLRRDESGAVEPPTCPACTALLLPLTLLFDEQYTAHPFFRHATLEDWFDRADALVFVGTSFSVGITTAAMDTAMLWGAEVFDFNIEPQRPPCARIITPILSVVGPCEDTLPLLAQECLPPAPRGISRITAAIASAPAALLPTSIQQSCSIM